MRKIYFLFFAFLSLFSEVIFIIDDAISSIKATNLYVYLSLNIQNNNIKNTIYFNNENNLYPNNNITFNGNIFFQKLPSINTGNYFLVLDENNNLGIYDSLMTSKNKILKDSYNSITANIILEADNNGLLIQNNTYNNTTINAINKINFNGSSIFINDTINTSNDQINIYNLDKTNIISVPFDIDGNNIEFKGLNLTVSEIDMKNFFSYNNVINIFANILFTKATTFNSNSDSGNISFLSDTGEIKLSKNLILPNIGSTDVGDNITCLTIDNNYIKKSSFFLKSNIILLPLNTDILIGNNTKDTCTITFDNKTFSNTKLTISNIITNDCMLLGEDFFDINTNFKNININNLWNRYNISECHLSGSGTINIDLITNMSSIIFNGKTIFNCPHGIDVTYLSTANYSDTVKQLVMINQDGLIGYISTPKNDQKNYMTNIEDIVLYDDLIELYISYYNSIDLKYNSENNDIINFIKNIFIKKKNNELFNTLFQYDIEKDLLYYNPIFAEELLKNKTNSLAASFSTSTKDITAQKKNIDQELDNALIKIKNCIEEIISTSNLKKGQII